MRHVHCSLFKKKAMVDMREIEDKLENLMVTNNWSKTQLKAEVKNRGICLGDGEEYGSALQRILKKKPMPHRQPEDGQKVPAGQNVPC